MDKFDLIKKVMKKKEFSKLPEKDVLIAFSHFERRQCSDDEKVKLTRDLLRKVFSAFINVRIFSFKKRGYEDVLRKHKSTRERFDNYNEVYSRIFKGLDKKLSIFDFGAGVNGFSFSFFNKLKYKVDYYGFESVGQLVDLMNNYFKREKYHARAFNISLFDLKAVKKVISKSKKPRVAFLMKIVDSLEILQKDYSKEFILEISPLFDRFVVSFATKSLVKRERFKVKRYWFENFLKEHFNIIDDFEIGGERYIIFERI